MCCTIKNDTVLLFSKPNVDISSSKTAIIYSHKKLEKKRKEKTAMLGKHPFIYF